MELKLNSDTPVIMTPSAGWSAIILDTFHGNLSYIQNVAKDLLQWILNYLDNSNAVVTFDEEGSEFLLVLTPYTTYVIAEREETKFHRFEIDAPILYNRILKDITDNLDKWAAFDVMAVSKEDFKNETKKNKDELNHLLTKIFFHPNYRKD